MNTSHYGSDESVYRSNKNKNQSDLINRLARPAPFCQIANVRILHVVTNLDAIHVV